MAVLAACESDSALQVDNVDEPDVGRAFSTADGIEAILRNGMSQMLGAVSGTTNIQPAAHVMAFESYGSVNNFGMNLRATIPRVGIDNDRGNTYQAENFADFRLLSLRGRTLSNAIRALDAFTAGGGSLGSQGANLRARSFGFFSLGLSNGMMALMYDSVGVSTPALESTDIPPLTGYMASMDIALQQLDSAIALGTAANAAGGAFPLPATWIRRGGGVTTTSFDDYVRMIRSLKARLRAGVARTPAERTAVNWNAVVTDAAAGITSDFVLDLNANEGWGHGWISQAMVFTGWHGMTPYIIGMADTSSGYAGWIGSTRANRTPFLIHTPDTRFPSGATRAAQLANSPAANAILPEIRFRNRAVGDDSPGESWGNSYYDFIRFRSYRTNSSIGPWVWMSATEIAMLRAEGLIRTNRASEAVTLINASRTAHGLPAFAAGATADTRAPAHPGGSANSCVPRVPSGNSLVCGTLFEAMKWEKRMETIFTGYAQWFIDSRGWGDLPAGTSTQWPVPYQEMDARRQAFYNSQPTWVAGTSTYGFGSGTN